MNAKKILGFVFCTSAFSQRNVSSVFLVIALFVGYLLAGGKISTSVPELSKAAKLPGITKSSDFGGFTSEEEKKSLLPDKQATIDPQRVLGVSQSEERQQREKAILERGRAFTDEDAELEARKPIDRSGLVEGNDPLSARQESILKRTEKKPVDSLSAIEERLNIKRR